MKIFVLVNSPLAPSLRPHTYKISLRHYKNRHRLEEGAHARQPRQSGVNIYGLQVTLVTILTGLCKINPKCEALIICQRDLKFYTYFIPTQSIHTYTQYETLRNQVITKHINTYCISEIISCDRFYSETFTHHWTGSYSHTNYIITQNDYILTQSASVFFLYETFSKF